MLKSVRPGGPRGDGRDARRNAPGCQRSWGETRRCRRRHQAGLRRRTEIQASLTVLVVIDTIAVVSEIHFGGVPAQVLACWGDARFEIVATPDILGEYQRICTVMRERHPTVDPRPVLAALHAEAKVIHAAELAESVCRDPDDDKFIACVLACRVPRPVIVSGDRDLLAVSGYRGGSASGVAGARETVDRCCACRTPLPRQRCRGTSEVEHSRTLRHVQRGCCEFERRSGHRIDADGGGARRGCGRVADAGRPGGLPRGAGGRGDLV